MDFNDEQLRKYCTVCKKVTDWEDGFDITTGMFNEWCAEHEVPSDEDREIITIKL